MKNFSYMSRNKILSEIEGEDYDVLLILSGCCYLFIKKDLLASIPLL